MPTIPLSYENLTPAMTILAVTCLFGGFLSLLSLIAAIDEHFENKRKEKPVNQINQFVTAVAPALKAAFIHAAKIAVYIVLSAAIAAIYAYLAGNTSVDPSVVLIVNVALAAATKAIQTLNA